ncbi:hypothetical protein BU15DRAFT_68088 [Melanogaster broomeanus]|nr:hypothetical protein BU15DRAFT_68088 [Melanogaster broomeanus]
MTCMMHDGRARWVQVGWNEVGRMLLVSWGYEMAIRTAGISVRSPRPTKDLRTIYLETERGAKAIESPTTVFEKGENNSSRIVFRPVVSIRNPRKLAMEVRTSRTYYNERDFQQLLELAGIQNFLISQSALRRK